MWAYTYLKTYTMRKNVKFRTINLSLQKSYRVSRENINDILRLCIQLMNMMIDSRECIAFDRIFDQM